MLRYFLWGKRVGNDIVKPFAILSVRLSDPIIALITADGSSEVLWRFIALRLVARYPSYFPPIWSDKGHVNLFWVNNVIVREVNASEIPSLERSLPIFHI